MIAAAVNRLHPGPGKARTFFLPFGHFDERKRAVAARLKWILVVCTVAAALAAPAPAVAGQAGGLTGRTTREGSTVDVKAIPARLAATRPADAIWSWCGLFDGDQKVVRAFERYRGDAGGGHRLKGGTSNLRCGSSEESGYRHIQAGHQSQWEFDAWLVGTNWRNQADFAIATVLRDPDRVTYNARNDTYCYSRLVYLERKSDRRVVGDRKPNVVIGARNLNIITAFPSNYNCRQVK